MNLYTYSSLSNERNRNNRCVYVSGLMFLLSFIITSSLLEVSVFYWIGDVKNHKCIIRIWLIIISVNFIFIFFLKRIYIYKLKTFYYLENIILFICIIY